MNDEIRDPFAAEPDAEAQGDDLSQKTDSAEKTGSFERLPDDLKGIHASLDEEPPDEAGFADDEGAESQDSEAPAEPPADETVGGPSDETPSEPQPEGEQSPYPDYAGADATAVLTPLGPPVEQDWIDAAPQLQPIEGEDGLPPAIPGIDLGPEKRSRGWLWVLLGVMIIGLLGAFGYGWWYTTQRPIGVPKVVGKLPAQAVQSINDAGLRLGKVSEVPTETSAPGTVISQSPLPGAKLVPGSAVSIAVASAPESVKVPEVFSMTENDAKVELAKQRLAALTVEVADANIAEGSVSAQIPLADTRMTPGSLVVLVISKGPAPSQLRVPRVVGLRESDAEILLKSAGLRGKRYQTPDASITAGEVMEQSPSADSFAPYDGVVLYTVSAGPGTYSVTVPNVVGTAEKSAKKALTDKGFKVTVSRVPNAGVAKGNVVAQTPSGGRKSSSGVTVGLLVSKGALTTGTIPDITGMASTDATAAITKAGFIPLKVEIETNGQTEGTVIGQFPVSQSAWVLRLPVVMVVAKE